MYIVRRASWNGTKYENVISGEFVMSAILSRVYILQPDIEMEWRWLYDEYLFFITLLWFIFGFLVLFRKLRPHLYSPNVPPHINDAKIDDGIASGGTIFWWKYI